MREGRRTGKGERGGEGCPVRVLSSPLPFMRTTSALSSLPWRAPHPAPPAPAQKGGFPNPMRMLHRLAAPVAAAVFVGAGAIVGGGNGEGRSAPRKAKGTTKRVTSPRRKDGEPRATGMGSPSPVGQP